MAENNIKPAEAEISVATPASPAAAQIRATEASAARCVHDALGDDEVAEALKLLHLRSKD